MYGKKEKLLHKTSNLLNFITNTYERFDFSISTCEEKIVLAIL